VLPNTADHAGFIDPINDPIGLPVAALGLLFDQQWGLLIAAPIYLLAAVGLAAMRRAPGGRAGLWWLLAVTVPYIGLITVYLQWWGEWCPPARYLAPVVPLLAWPLAQGLTALRNSTIYNLLFGFLTAPGWAVMVGMILHPRSMWNHPNGQSNLLAWVASQTHLDLSPHIPAIATWFYYHTYGKPSPVPLSWPLVAAWSGLALAILMAGLLLLVTTPPAPPESSEV
jgi:hypothetical protein